MKDMIEQIKSNEFLKANNGTAVISFDVFNKAVNNWLNEMTKYDGVGIYNYSIYNGTNDYSFNFILLNNHVKKHVPFLPRIEAKFNKDRFNINIRLLDYNKSTSDKAVYINEKVNDVYLSNENSIYQLLNILYENYINQVITIDKKNNTIGFSELIDNEKQKILDLNSQVLHKQNYITEGTKQRFIVAEDFVYKDLSIKRNSFVDYDGKSTININFIDFYYPEYFIDIPSFEKLNKLIWYKNSFVDYKSLIKSPIETGILSLDKLKYNEIEFLPLHYKFNTEKKVLEEFIGKDTSILGVNIDVLFDTQILDYYEQSPKSYYLRLYNQFEYNGFVINDEMEINKVLKENEELVYLSFLLQDNIEVINLETNKKTVLKKMSLVKLYVNKPNEIILYNTGVIYKLINKTK